MHHFATLERLPHGITLPEHLLDRVSYFPERRQLMYRGFMTKCAYDELIALSSDLEYRRALEQLFVLSSKEAIARAPPVPRLFILSVCILSSVVFAIAIGWITVRSFSYSQEKALDLQLTESPKAK